MNCVKSKYNFLLSTRLEKYEEHNEPYRSGTNLVSYKIYLQNIVTNNKNAEKYKKELLFITFVWHIIFTF